MKKIILIAVLATGLCATAQKRVRGDVEITPYIGYHSSTYSSNYISNTNTLNTLQFGVLGDFYFNNRWSIRTGLQSQTMGVEAFGFDEKLNYIQIPVNANWHFGSSRAWNLNFGLTGGVLTSAKSGGEDISELVEGTQIGLSFGIGYKIFLNKRTGLLIDYQAFSGMTDITKNPRFDVRNIGGSLNLGCVVRL